MAPLLLVSGLKASELGMGDASWGCSESTWRTGSQELGWRRVAGHVLLGGRKPRLRVRGQHAPLGVTNNNGLGHNGTNTESEPQST